MKTIRLMVVCGLLGLLGLQASAQVGGGLYVGGIASQIDGDLYGGYNKLGYHLGGFAIFSIDETFELEPEILIGQRGARQANQGAIYHTRLNYIDVPVLLNARLEVADGTHIMLQAGPSVGVLYNANSGIPDFKIDVSSYFTRAELGGIIGGTAEFSEKFGLSMRWGISLTNINASQYPFTRNRYIEVGLRYLWR